jgi:hypothetical protein
MRVTSVLVAAALAATSAIALPAQNAAADTGYTALVIDRDPLANTSGGVAYDASNSTVAVTAGKPDDSMPFEFQADPGVSPATTAWPASFTITTQNTGALSVGDGQAIDASATDGVHVWVDGCSSTGTLNVIELTVDSGTNVITALAADFTMTCEAAAGYPTVNGSVRWNSSVAFAGVMAKPLDWDFGSQLIKHNDPSKKLSFANRGSLPITYGTATISGSTDAMSINHSRDTCSGHTILAGASCSITVVPHPQRAVGGSYAGSVNKLHLPSVDLIREIVVALRVEGRTYYPIQAHGGPGHITFGWEQLAGPVSYFAQYYRVYRGTTPTSLTFLRNDTSGYNRIVDRSVTVGKTYYYSVRPVYTQGEGAASPVVAALAWPRYSAGMYHRLPTTTRFLDSHVVRAGHPFSLKIVGQHAVPGSGVSAVALNLTAGGSTAATSVRVYPAGSSQPRPADLNLKPGISRTNVVLAKLGRYGKVKISTAQGSVRISADVSGYFSGSRLSHKYGMGGALHDYAYPGTIMDTKAYHIGAIKHDYYLNAPVNFTAATTPHVTSLLVEITAYSSKGSGTITGFTTNHRPGGSTVLSYSPNTWTSNTAIIRSGLWYSPSNGNSYPSVSFLNRGRKPVQLIVSILGYVDDNTFEFGERYTPTAPAHIFGKKLHADSTAKFNPGRYASMWTFTFNAKITATGATRTTSLAIKAIGGGPAPSHGQVHVPAHTTVTGTTLPPTGVDNEMAIHNAAGTVTVNIWSFGKFNAYPIPLKTSEYAGGPTPADSTLYTPQSTSLRTASAPPLVVLATQVIRLR